MPLNNYNGNQPVVHTVTRGESLSLIAGKYGFASWQPIWVYNTKVHTVLGPNPDLVVTGAKLFIPRSRPGYEILLRKLRALKDQVSGEADRLRYELEAEGYRHKAQRVMFDLAGDVATLIGTVAVKAAQAARTAKAAATATGKARVAAQYLADTEAKALAEELAGSLKDKAVNAVLTSVDEDLGGAHKDLYLTQKKGINAVRGVSLKGGKSFLDIADLLLDYVSVSNVADGMIAVWIGETPGKTYDTAMKGLRESVDSSRAMIDQKIALYSRERDMLYVPGGSK